MWTGLGLSIYALADTGVGAQMLAAALGVVGSAAILFAVATMQAAAVSSERIAEATGPARRNGATENVLHKRDPSFLRCSVLARSPPPLRYLLGSTNRFTPSINFGKLKLISSRRDPPIASPVGRSMWSITKIFTIDSGCSFSPSCSCSAVKISGASLQSGASGDARGWRATSSSA